MQTTNKVMNLKKRSLYKLRTGIMSLVLMTSILLAGCANSATNQNAVDEKTSEVTIVTSFYPMYISTLNVVKGIEGVKVVDMTPPTAGCLHDYSITPEDMVRIEGADIFVVNGAGMESFMDKVISQYPELEVVEASQDIPLIAGDEEEGDNPHVWLSITNAIAQVKNIQTQLVALDAKHAAQYNENAESYIEQLTQLKQEMHDAIDSLPNKDIITFHEAFPYFAQEFGLNIVAVIEREPGTEPSAKELADTIQIVKDNQVKALFAEPQYPAKAAQTIAQETNIPLYVLDPAVTGEEIEGAYLTAMRKNMEVLLEALK